MIMISSNCFRWLCSALLVLPLLASCSGSDDAAAGSLQSEKLLFSPGFLEVDDNTTMASVELSWKSSWEIRLDDGDIIETVSPTSGGTEGGTGTTTISFVLNENSSESRRVHELVAIDDNGTERRFIIAQNGFAQWNRVNVDRTTRYQKVVGFGGMYNPYIWTPSNLVTNSEIDKLYGSDGLGYNIMRLMIYNDKSAWTKDVSGAQRAVKNGATIFACPWDCNAAWIDSVTVGSSMRKHLKAEHYADYADHLCNFVTYMKGRSVPIYGITVQNEPDGSFVYWTSDELASFIAQYGAKIRATGVKLMSPEPEGVNINYIENVVSNSGAMANIDIVATHTYTGFINDADNGPARRSYLAGLYETRLQPDGKSWWMTEHLFNDGSTAADAEGRLFQQWDYNLTHLAKEIHLCMQSYCSAYIYWYLKRYYGLIGDNDPLSPVASGEVTKNGYIMSHYAAYAAGTVRIAAEAERSDIDVTAYEKSTTEMTVVLTNYSDEELPVSVTGMGATRAAAVATTASYDMERLTTKCVSGDIHLTLPPMSLVSVRCYVD